MNRRTCLLIGWTLGLAGMAACGDKNKSVAPTIPEARPQPYVRDIPVPDKFERDEQKSAYDSSPGRRAVRDYYVGKLDSLSVRNFYFHNMPLNDWELVDEKLIGAVYQLNYKKADQRCEVRVERMPGKGLFKGERTQVCVTIPDGRVEVTETPPP